MPLLFSKLSPPLLKCYSPVWNQSAAQREEGRDTHSGLPSPQGGCLPPTRAPALLREAALRQTAPWPLLGVSLSSSGPRGVGETWAPGKLHPTHLEYNATACLRGQ